jgi:hypothetical protein
MGVATYCSEKAGRRVFVMLVVKVMCGRLPVWACWELKFWKAARQLAAGRGGGGGCEAGKQVGRVRFRFAGFDGAWRVKRLGKAWVETRRGRRRRWWVVVRDSIFGKC